MIKSISIYNLQIFCHCAHFLSPHIPPLSPKTTPSLLCSLDTITLVSPHSAGDIIEHSLLLGGWVEVTRIVADKGERAQSGEGAGGG